ncbi:helix-turn-helix domain-containing protein [Achromobacter xylosoxidans]|jgi:hypothetical protein|uniref:Helix-turn-helix transcriptional regulator n=2 Tax=Alcaligenes xylosoxydans xylosoxydans TaxID=85698 RepID=A0A9X3L2R8_ALCXX|nr:helix-turn-helix transcriptional regulator [Achromobacter xylosoxidans]MCZ8404617.1 helix-turn-helix transcriptional regulator [Achromobacter xylosoxidans]QQE59621.1 helix-turn-helix transcriptional regulator [Achromobacter xylosoxidans]QQV13365.1 helix-turn-helix transcriptional regulator [Achromobacter xylosoxidans]UXL03413.1 helix-turn-helix transcriptional regulator [Achromobacter xylosoxidans]
MNRARKSCHTPPDADASSSAEDGMLHAEGLSTSALLSLWLRSRPPGPLRCSVVRALMSAHGWTSLRAWRHWRGHSKAEMARRLNIHLATYELIEDGTVDLGPWVLPAVEKILLD